MKTLYKYFGSGSCELSNIAFHGFGSKGELTDEQALDCIKAGAGLITAVQFDSVFTAADHSRRRGSDPTFLTRNSTALEYRNVLEQYLVEKIAAASIPAVVVEVDFDEPEQITNDETVKE